MPGRVTTDYRRVDGGQAAPWRRVAGLRGPRTRARGPGPPVRSSGGRCRPRGRGCARAGALPAGDVAASVLGYAVIGGSVLRSVPQIVRMTKARSAEGVSFVANYVELLAFTVILAYNLSRGFPFSTYGEVVFCWAQDVAIVALVLWFTAHMTKRQGAVVAASVAAWSWFLFSGACGPALLLALQACTMPAMGLGRIPQIVLAHRNGGTGELSLITSLLNVIGNVIRIFTTIQLTGDLVLTAGHSAILLVNGTIAVQCLQTELKKRRGGSSRLAGA